MEGVHIWNQCSKTLTKIKVKQATLDGTLSTSFKLWPFYAPKWHSKHESEKSSCVYDYSRAINESRGSEWHLQL